MTIYCKPQLLAQLSAAEISPDQAIPHFSYKDNEQNLDVMAFGDGFFNPIASQVKIGSTIKLYGKLTEPSTGTEFSYPTVVVEDILRNPVSPAPDYPFYVLQRVVNDSVTIANQETANPDVISTLRIQATSLKFKGFILGDIPIVTPDQENYCNVTMPSALQIVDTDLAFGTFAGSGVSASPPGTYNRCYISETKTGPNPNQISFFLAATSTLPSDPGRAYIYCEVHRPLTEIMTS